MKFDYILVSILLAGIVGCTPTVKVEPPDKPIEINLNVKIDHEIRIKGRQGPRAALRISVGHFLGGQIHA